MNNSKIVLGTQQEWLGELDGSSDVMADAATIAKILGSYERTAEAVGVLLYALQMSAADAAGQMGPEVFKLVAQQYEAIRSALDQALPTVRKIDDQLLASDV